MSHSKAAQPLRVINAVAPIRICDMGGWTDTWFAGYGAICNIGVAPFVETQIAVYPRAAHTNQITLHAENFGDRYAVQPGMSGRARHPLLEAAIADMHPPEDLALEITIHSEVPAGASTGTSASVCVALIGALDALTPGRMTAHEVAYRAHRVETERLRLQSGIQDQLCAAYGALNFIEMFKYPHASVSPIPLTDSTWWELERRLVLVFLGKTHNSSAVHEQVIAGLERAGGAAPPLEALRLAAVRARDALVGGDFQALGQAMIANTAAQQALHPALIGAEARALIALAQTHDVIGWKVNGAGGDGGSVTLLCGPHASARRNLLRAITEANPLFRPIPIALSRSGLRVWDSPL
ncbi:MAG TPA: GHMP kinase [Roseiflexaceae bacterium]|nr:GHMP kinase [Roseiflexaceae bacterium]